MKFKFRNFTQNNLGGILLNLFLAMGILLLLAVIYFYVYLPNTTNHGETITVPNIEGMQVGELDGFLTKDLRYEVDDSVYSADYPPLTVIKQYPHAGAKVKEGRKIYIAINHLNPPSVPVPNLVDGSVVNADAVLKSNELKRGRIELVSGPFNVVKQMKYQGNNIEPGARVPKGSVIDLVVMDGNIGKGFPIDNLVGQEFEDAKIYLLGVSLNFDVETVGDTTGVTPVILKQKPAAG
ncbi:MAG TPA: PASTA domain-containing protein, partial [Ohtaekwangia sp.]|nr:PASTA domain-containing protein [Ohtaekwangia sp.]